MTPALESEAVHPPFDEAEVRGGFVRPDLALSMILAEPRRWVATLGTAQGDRLTLLTLQTAMLAAVPFGAYFGPHRLMHVAALFVGSAALCAPSLHVFATYLGAQLRVGQTLALSTLVAAVASLFSLGFAPIVFFLRATVADRAVSSTMGPLVDTLLTVSTLVGMGQLLRCLQARELLGLSRTVSILMVGWLFLFGFISYRMARLLGLTA